VPVIHSTHPPITCESKVALLVAALCLNSVA
jgi:hypothetical protein